LLGLGGIVHQRTTTESTSDGLSAQGGQSDHDKPQRLPVLTSDEFDEILDRMSGRDFKPRQEVYRRLEETSSSEQLVHEYKQVGRYAEKRSREVVSANYNMFIESSKAISTLEEEIARVRELMKSSLATIKAIGEHQKAFQEDLSKDRLHRPRRTVSENGGHGQDDMQEQQLRKQLEKIQDSIDVRRFEEAITELENAWQSFRELCERDNLPRRWTMEAIGSLQDHLVERLCDELRNSSWTESIDEVTHSRARAWCPMGQ
jgi:hypothetical protein